MWDKACVALFAPWQLTCQVGRVGEEQAGVPQLAGLGVEPSHPAARMGEGGLKGWCVTEQHVPAPFVLCQCLLTLLLLLHSWEALEGGECMEMYGVAGSRELSTAFGPFVTQKDIEIQIHAKLSMGSRSSARCVSQFTELQPRLAAELPKGLVWM